MVENNTLIPLGMGYVTDEYINSQFFLAEKDCELSRESFGEEAKTVSFSKDVLVVKNNNQTSKCLRAGEIMFLGDRISSRIIVPENTEIFVFSFSS